MIPLFKVFMNKDVNSYLLETIHSGWIGQGEKVELFEKALCNRFNNSNVVALSAGTHGLHLALILAGVEEGDEVITTALTCTAMNWPILMQRAKIVWADIKKSDLNIDPIDIERKITSKTKAIMAVHWGGYPCDLFEIATIAKKYNLLFIADAAHACGATYGRLEIGHCIMEDYTVFSFQAIKHITCGDGGALFTKHYVDAERARRLRWFGIDREKICKDMRCEEDVEEFGYMYHMNDIAAVIGICNLKKLDWMIEKQKSNADYYREELKNINGITLLENKDDRESANWFFSMLIENRERFFDRMNYMKQIHVSRVHERNDKFSCTEEFKIDLPNLNEVADKIIALPCGWWVGKEDREYIVNSIKEGW